VTQFGFLEAKLFARRFMTKHLSWKLALVLVLIPASAFAQLPFSAGYKPVVSADFGYSYMSMPIPSAGRINLNGVNAGITVDFRSRFGAKVDFNYDRAANVFGTGRHSDVLSYMVGPVFYPVSNDLLTIYIQALAGDSRIDGVIPNKAGGYEVAFASGPSWAIGGGIERSIFSSLAIRSETDYLHTSFTDSSAVLRGQSDLRISSSLVFRWGRHSESSRYHRHS
jgi:hypothetical protein